MKKLVSHAFFALLPLFCLAGCGEFEVVDPAFQIEEKQSVAVVPFRDTMFTNGWESPLGCELAGNVTRKLRDAGEFQVVNKDRVSVLYNPSDANAGEPPGAREIAAKTKADYVLMAEVVHWQTKDDGMNDGGLLRGMAIIDVSLFETYDAAVLRAKSDKDKQELPPPGKGRLVLAKKRVQAVFPRDYGMAGFGTTTMTPEEVEDGLKLAAAQQVAWVLLSHTKDEEKKAEGK
jgi:hypothetical protein